MRSEAELFQIVLRLHMALLDAAINPFNFHKDGAAFDLCGLVFVDGQRR
jgi:hypothetical protein